MIKEIREWIILTFAAILVVLCIRTFITEPYQISGDSMYPALEDKERVMLNKFSSWTNGLNRGDIIIFHVNKETDYVKRLIGLPGDKIEYIDDLLYVNGKAVEENYLRLNRELSVNPKLTEDFSVKTLAHAGGNDRIPKGKYLVLGDNREVSLDSRKPELGLINRDQVAGKVSFRFMPFKKFETRFNEDDFQAVNK